MIAELSSRASVNSRSPYHPRLHITAATSWLTPVERLLRHVRSLHCWCKTRRASFSTSKWEEVERGEVSPGSFTIRNMANAQKTTAMFVRPADDQTLALYDWKCCVAPAWRAPFARLLLCKSSLEWAQAEWCDGACKLD
jgi:hypothetical protein